MRGPIPARESSHEDFFALLDIRRNRVVSEERSLFGALDRALRLGKEHVVTP